MLNWGFVLLQKDKAPKRVTNIRDDKAQTKFWRTSFEQRRCLVPASSYCEPKGEKPATWHWFSINGDDARPVFAFPGVWTRYKGPLKKNGETLEQEVFAFMTTEPNELTASINHERMPVLLTDPADFETWLSGSTAEAFNLARSYAADQMRMVQSGPNAKTFSPHEHSVNTTCRGLLRPSLFPADRRDLEHFSVQLDGFGEVRKFHPGLDALRVLRRPRLEFKIGFGGEEEFELSPGIRVLILQRDHDEVVRLLNLHDQGIADEVDIAAQDEPERGLIQLDPILGVEVEILDREILAIGDDDLPRRASVVEAEAARALHSRTCPSCGDCRSWFGRSRHKPCEGR